MDTLSYIIAGFQVALLPLNLLYVLVGVFIGTVIGVLPGIGPAAGVALLLPITFGMDPTSALIMLSGIYYGAMYGGSTTSILINTPGESSSVMTAIDGYQMARKGRAGAALAVSAIGSFIAGTVSIVLLTLFALPLASFALKFGPPEYFGLMLFGLTAVTCLTGKSFAKGMISTLLGLMLATVGIDLQSGSPRFTMGLIDLQDGVEFLVVVVGLFAIAEVLRGVEALGEGESPPIRISGRLWMTREEWRQSVGPIWRGSLIGFLIGVTPGAGATIASILSYAAEKRLSRTPERFGHGAIEGVAGPESANNAATGGAMVPLLALGVPGSGTTAVMLGAFIMYGIQPGPLLFQNRPDLVWGLVDSMYIGNLMLLILNLPLVGVFARLLYVPTGMLLPLILAIAMLGVYASNGSEVDLWTTLAFGVMGYAFSKLDVPIAPFVLAMVLGNSMEQSFRRAMTISSGDLTIFVSSPLSASLIALAVLSVALPILLPRLGRWRRTAAADTGI
jgi:putative tricarboxylic transport membrane protein